MLYNILFVQFDLELLFSDKYLKRACNLFEKFASYKYLKRACNLFEKFASHENTSNVKTHAFYLNLIHYMVKVYMKFCIRKTSSFCTLSYNENFNLL